VSAGPEPILNREEKGKEMGQLQADRKMTASALAREKVKVKRHLQAWHYLIPIFSVFWIVFGMVLLTDDFLFISALAVLIVFSVLIVALAWAFQNDV
jgi:hypothetical protein